MKSFPRPPVPSLSPPARISTTHNGAPRSGTMHSGMRGRVALVALLLLCLVGLAAAARPAPAAAAEFHINGPTVELRRVQYCQECGEPLMVTTITPGAAIRCPTCTTVQRRLPTRMLLTKVYQVCPSCSSRMDVSNLEAGQPCRCATCGLTQHVVPEAIHRPEPHHGQGVAPAPTVVPDVDGREPEWLKRQRKRCAPVAQPATEPVAPPQPGSTPDMTPAGPPSAPSESTPSPVPSAPPAPEAPVVDPTRKTGRRSTPRFDPVAMSAALEEGPELEPAAFQPRAAIPRDPRPTPARRVLDRRESLHVAATVNGQPVHKADLEVALDGAIAALRVRMGRKAFSPAGRDLLQRRREALRPTMLEMLIGRELIRQAAEREGVRPLESEVMRVAERMRAEGGINGRPGSLLEQARFQLQLEAMRQRHGVPTGEIAPAAIHRAYKERSEEFRQPARAALRALVIHHERQGRRDDRAASVIAAEVQRRLGAREPFADLVRRFSEGPFAGSGGALRVDETPYVDLAHLARPVQRALREAESGAVVGPIQLVSTLVFVQVERLEHAAPAPFAQVREALRERLEQEARDKAFATWVKRLEREAVIETY